MSELFFLSLANIFDFLELGGPVVGLLLAISVLSLAIIILKYVQFFLAGLGAQSRVDNALSEWSTGRLDSALKTLSGSRSVTAQITWQAMAAITRGSAADDQSALEDRLEAEAGAKIVELKRGFRALESIAQITPLLGLFGTVLGMIEAFQQLQAAGASVDPSVLAGGIWVALLTTAVGLGVAIPTSLVLTHLESRVARETSLMEYALTRLLNPLQLPAPNGSSQITPKAADLATQG